MRYLHLTEFSVQSKCQRQGADKMENMNIIIPKAIDNLQLPDPELRNFYVDLDHRAFWVDDEIT